MQNLQSTIGQTSNLSRDNMLNDVSVHSDVLTQDSIMKHHAECKLDNKLRLKEVRNLEELINFRIKTVSDKLEEDGTIVNEVSMKKGLYALRAVVDPRLQGTTAFPAVSKKNRRLV